MKNTCNEWSKALDETRKLVVSCTNEICMCNIQLADNLPVQTTQIQDVTEKTEVAKTITENTKDST